LEFEYSKFVPQELITKLEASVATQRNKTAVAVSDNNRDNEETVSSGLVEFHVEYDNVESKDQSGVMPGCHSYDQYCLDQYCFRLGQLNVVCCHGYCGYYAGDYVYLRSDEQQSFIARIERMWTDEKYWNCLLQSMCSVYACMCTYVSTCSSVCVCACAFNTVGGLQGCICMLHTMLFL